MRVLVLVFCLLMAGPALAADLTVTVRNSAGKPVPDAVVTVYPAGGVPGGPIHFDWPLRMAQHNLQVEPFVLVVPVGGMVAFPNQDPVRQHVIAPNGAILKLSDLEWRTLECLARRCSQLVTRQELAEQVWKRPLNPEDRSIDITISRIRKMIQPYMDGHPTIRSVRGRGYIFTAFDLPPSHDLPISPPSSDPILDGNERA